MVEQVVEEQDQVLVYQVVQQEQLILVVEVEQEKIQEEIQEPAVQESLS